jgi:gentisate 1,2-dioxygenase
MSKDKRLDHEVLQESQNYKNHLDQLDIKTLWEELDKLVPKENE